jgi:hypothetical protein
MGKRLYRIFAKDIPSQLSNLIGTELNLILKDKKTYHGIIIRYEGQEIEFKDFLSGKHLIRLEEISEIVYDKEAAY